MSLNANVNQLRLLVLSLGSLLLAGASGSLAEEVKIRLLSKRRD